MKDISSIVLFIVLISAKTTAQNIKIEPIDSIVVFQDKVLCYPKMAIRVSIIDAPEECAKDSLFFPEVIFNCNYVNQGRYCNLRYYLDTLNQTKVEFNRMQNYGLNANQSVVVRDFPMGLRLFIGGRNQKILSIPVKDTSLILYVNFYADNLLKVHPDYLPKQFKYVISYKSERIEREFASDWINMKFCWKSEWRELQNKWIRKELGFAYHMFSWLVPISLRCDWYLKKTGQYHPRAGGGADDVIFSDQIFMEKKSE
jgi:hypothetical protein